MSTWVVHEGAFTIGFFDLIICGTLAHAQHLVIIFPFTLLQLQLCRFQQMLVIYSNKRQNRPCKYVYM